MKQLYLIGGTMGIGKTTVCHLLKRQLDHAVMLDGDWCWDADPFQVTEETKAIVLDNICYVLNNFIRSTAYTNILFCWVMHEQRIIDTILSRLDTHACKVKTISLVCTPEALTARLTRDIAEGTRQADIVERSVGRLPLYDALDTIKIDVSARTPEDTAAQIAAL